MKQKFFLIILIYLNSPIVFSLKCYQCFDYDFINKDECLNKTNLKIIECPENNFCVFMIYRQFRIKTSLRDCCSDTRCIEKHILSGGLMSDIENYSCTTDLCNSNDGTMSNFYLVIGCSIFVFLMKIIQSV